MSQIEMLRLLLTQRLTAAAEEIFTVFGRTIADYEEEISRCRLEISRQSRILELRRTPRVRLRNPGLSEDWSSCVDVNDIKEEEQEEEQGEELWDTPPRAEENHMGLVLLPSDGVKGEQDDDQLSKLQSQKEEEEEEEEEEGLDQELEDSGALDPDPGSSARQSGSDEASGDGQADGVAGDPAPSQPVDSYICGICGRAFSLRGRWAKHVQVHRRLQGQAQVKLDKSYTCDICGKRLTRFDGYQKHLRVHTGEKPYGCSHCGRRFSDNSNYKRHIRTHTHTHS